MAITVNYRGQWYEPDSALAAEHLQHPPWTNLNKQRNTFCLLEPFSLLKAGGTTHFFSPRSYNIYIYINKYTKLYSSYSFTYSHHYSNPAGYHLDKCWGQNPGSHSRCGITYRATGKGTRESSPGMSGTAAPRVHVQKHTPHIRTNTHTPTKTCQHGHRYMLLTRAGL